MALATNTVESHLRNTRWLMLFCLFLLNTWRVYWFAAAFPFFCNVDEEAHLDTVIKYSKGQLPSLSANQFVLEPETSELVLIYRSPEFFWGEATSYAGRPFWKQAQQKEGQEQIAAARKSWVWPDNHEAFSPPLYYVLAGVWFGAGKLVGLFGGTLLYWIRFLNIPISMALFWYAILFCERVFHDDLPSQVSVLVLLAVFPQDVFYSINSDVLSPLLCLMCLFLLLRIVSEDESVQVHLLAGTVAALAVLTKLTNGPIVAILLVVCTLRIRQLVSESRFSPQIPKLCGLVLSCALPILAWLVFNRYVLGDLTGNAAKVRSLGWTAKPFHEFVHHPIFTFGGFSYFASELIKSFWRGEFFWHNKRLSYSSIDAIYLVTSLVFVVASVANSLRTSFQAISIRCLMIRIGALMLLLEFLQLALLSMMWDFGNSPYPSRELPYFTSGRLMLGCLVPFLLLYVDGLGVLLSLFEKRSHALAVVGMLSLTILGSELLLTQSARGSSFNWFHLKGDGDLSAVKNGWNDGANRK